MSASPHYKILFKTSIYNAYVDNYLHVDIHKKGRGNYLTSVLDLIELEELLRKYWYNTAYCDHIHPGEMLNLLGFNVGPFYG